MKIKVTFHYAAHDFAKTGEIHCIDVFVGKNLIAEFDEFPTYKYEGFYEALKYIHGKGLEVTKEFINDYYTREI